MPELKQAVELVTDPANVSDLPVTGPEERCAVNSKRVIRGLRELGAGKAEARELGIQAVTEAGGGAEIRSSRGARVAGGRGDGTAEDWWVPKSAVRFS
jgi:hypothetical protein